MGSNESGGGDDFLAFYSSGIEIVTSPDPSCQAIQRNESMSRIVVVGQQGRGSPEEL